ncbi:MAG: hypothetical protein JWO96_362 [Candidatus Saccharibacteria bacterium]|nr:hypothetical protein [Candidatus Saccharibacteria bacterium]
MSELQHQLDVETTVTAEPFAELMKFAVNTCLRDPDGYYRKLENLREEAAQSEQAKIASRIGLWPLREAVEISLNTAFRDESKLADISAPETLFMKVDPEIQLKIEAFGQAILDEAFLCLGQEAPNKVAEWLAAETTDEKKEILNWMLGVVYEIINIPMDENGHEIRDDSDDEDEEITEDGQEPDDPILYYHPVRLSPKFIGEYPQTDVEPACLGVSILAASFYQKLGVPYLHAGVVRTAPDEARTCSYLISEITKEYIADHGIELHARLEDLLAGLAKDTQEVLRSERGFHAAVLGQLDDEQWVQIDPHYKRNARLYEETSAELTTIHDTLSDLGNVIRGTEILWQNRNTLALNYFWNFAEELAAKPPRDDAEIESYLLNASPDTKVEDFVKEFLGDFLEGSEIESYTELRQVLTNLCDQTYETDYKFWVEEYILGQTVRSRVFPDAKYSDLSHSLARCKTDERYLKNRVEDLKLIPFYALLSLQLDTGNQVIRKAFNKAHSTFELGMPAYKIGASVLSHLAVWCGDELPPSFWLTYWPSQVSFADHANSGEAKSDAQRQLAYQTAQNIDRGLWTYLNISGIVDFVLDQGGAPTHGENQTGQARRAHGEGRDSPD